MTETPTETLRKKNRRLALMVLGVVVGMAGLSFAFVPIYDLICRVTGIGGTTQVAAGESKVVLDRVVTVRFDANTARDMPWRFSPQQRAVRTRLGENTLVFYKAHNTTDQPISGTALYNVTPLRAGKYFHKIACFCFDEQVLQPGQSIDMPVSFYIDPALNDDPGLADMTTITLSYTFFRMGSSALDKATEDFYNQPNTVTDELHDGDKPDTKQPE